MEKIKVSTTTRSDLIDITNDVQNIVNAKKVKNGVCFIFVPHTTAAVTINENADPSVIKDITNSLNKLIPAGRGYSHAEGNSDAHIKSSILGSSINIFVSNGRLCLGTWQGIFFAEGDGPRNREVWVEVISST